MGIEIFELGEIDESKLKLAIVGIEYNGKLEFGIEEDEPSWSVLNADINKGESVIETAVRVISEEIGATSFALKAVSDYSISKNGKKEYGRLFYSKVERYDSSLDEEVELRFFKLPKKLYNAIATSQGSL